MARAGSSPYEAKQRRKQGFLASLAKLEDRDTQTAAVTELQAALKTLDSDSLPLFITCVSSSNDKQKVFARKESTRFLGQLATDQCPVSQEAMAQPHIGKVIASVKAKFKDPDSSVREAASDAIASVMGGLATYSTKPLDQDHPLVRGLLEGLLDASKEVQASAADSLRKGAACLHCTPGLIRQVIKALCNSKGCLAPGAVLGALAGVADGDEGSPAALQGLLKHAPEAIAPSSASIVGTAAAGKLPATGAFSYVHSREWTVRKAACEALYAMAVKLGPLLDYGSAALLPSGDPGRISERAAAALETCKSDRIADVRRWAVAGLAVLVELKEFIESGQDPSEWCWSEHREEAAKERESKRPSGLASGSVKERFLKKSTQAAEGDDIEVVVKAPSGPPRPVSAPPGPPRHTAAPAAAPVPAVSQSVDASQMGGGVPRSPGEQQQQRRRKWGLEPVSQSVDGRAWSRTPPEHQQRSIPEEEEDLKQQLQQQHVEEEARRRGAMRGPQALAQMYEAPLPPPVPAAAPAPAPAPSAPQRHTQQQQQQQTAASVRRQPPEEAAEAYSPEAYSHQQMQQGPVPAGHPEQMISIPASEWAAVLQRLVAVEGTQARLATMEAQQERMLSMVENFALNTQNAFQAVESRVTALEAALDEISIDQHRPSPNEESNFYNATFAPEAAAPLDPMPDAPLSPSGIEAAFKVTLKEGVKETVELMGRTGPQWSLVSSSTALDLLAASRLAIQDRVPGALPAVLPWLWQLADEDVVNLTVPRQLAAATVAALRSVPPHEASAGGSNLQLLISALEWTWGSLLKQQQQAEEQKKMPPPQQQPPSGGGAPSGKPPLKIPSSASRGAGGSPSRIPMSPRRSSSDQSPFQGGTPPQQKLQARQQQQQQQQRLRPPSPSPGPRARSQSPLLPRALSDTPLSAGSAGGNRPPRQRASMGEGLNEMQAQLDAMQAELYNSPRVRGGS